MRVVIQRVLEASVSISGTVTAAIGPGLLVLLGIGYEDGAEDIEWLVKKIAGLRIFDDADGVMNVDVRDAGGDVLVVSQFTEASSPAESQRAASCSFRCGASPSSAHRKQCIVRWNSG